MIWVLMGILVLTVLLFVTKPLYAKRAPEMVQDSEVADYLREIAEIDRQIAKGDGGTLEATKLELQRAMLASKSKVIAKDVGPPPLLLASLFVVFGFAALGLYAMLGRPELTIAGALKIPTQSVRQVEPPQRESNVPLEQLVTRLEEKLKGDGNTVEGWSLYARTVMKMGRYDDALTAYDKAIVLSDNDQDLVSERAQAETFIAQSRDAGRQTGPSKTDMQAAANMSAEERQAMIAGMVEGLSQKLIDSPQNPEGWVRLLRARGVLGDTQKARVEIERMREAFKDKPETVDQILSASGWGNP